MPGSRIDHARRRTTWQSSHDVAIDRAHGDFLSNPTSTAANWIIWNSVVDKFPKIECTGVVLSDQQFDRARELALDLAGIELLERHRELLDRRFGRAGIRAEAIDAILIA